MLRDKLYGSVNIIHYSSWKSRRVCKSVLRAELLAFIYGHEVGYANTHTLQEMFGRKIDFTLRTDSRSLYVLCISLASISERRLKMNPAVIRQGYERREISNIVWIEGKNNPAQSLKKIKQRSDALMNVIRTDHFWPTVETWTERDGISYRHPVGVITVKAMIKSSIRMNFGYSKTRTVEYCNTNCMAQRWIKSVDYGLSQLLSRKASIV